MDLKGRGNAVRNLCTSWSRGGGVIGWVVQYYFRREERNWERRNELRRTALEALDIVHELLDVYDTYPQPEQVDEAHLQLLNDQVRKSKIRIRVIFGKENQEIVRTFQEAERALKQFVFAETDKDEQLRKSVNARQKVREFDEAVERYLPTL